MVFLEVWGDHHHNQFRWHVFIISWEPQSCVKKMEFSVGTYWFLVYFIYVCLWTYWPTAALVRCSYMIMGTFKLCIKNNDFFGILFLILFIMYTLEPADQQRFRWDFPTSEQFFKFLGSWVVKLSCYFYAAWWVPEVLFWGSLVMVSRKILKSETWKETANQLGYWKLTEIVTLDWKVW